MDCSSSSLSSPSPPPLSDMTDTTMVDSDQSSSQSKDKPTHSGHESSSQGPMLGQPIGFGWGPSQGPMGSSPYYPPHSSQQYPASAPYGPSDSEPPPSGSKKRASKGKEKEKDVSKGKSRSNKEKTSARTSTPKVVAHAESNSGESQGSTHTTSSFRVKGYINDPTQGPVPMLPGPTSYFPRQRVRSSSPAASEVPSEHAEPQGHDRPREKTSSRRSRKDRHHTEHPPPPPPLPPHPGYPYYPPPYPYGPYGYGAPPAGVHSSQETYYPQSQSTHPRYSPSQESSRSRRSAPSVASSDDPKKPRVITLLIDDLRINQSELAEVRVPLRPAQGGGYWADAKEVSKALQASASKVDGPARVYAMRGKYKQVFLRVGSDGEESYNSANLKIGDDKTVEVFVEYIATFGQQYLPVMSPRTESVASTSRKRRRSFDMPGGETYANPEPPSPRHASPEMQPEPSPSIGPSRGSSPMAVEEEPFHSHTQETHHNESASESRSPSDGTRKSLSPEGSEPPHPEQGMAPRSLFASQSSFDTAGSPFNTAPKPTPKPRPVQSPGMPAVQPTTPTQSPPAKKARHDENSDSDIEDMDPPRTQSQTQLAPAVGFGGFRVAPGPSAFSSSGFAGFAGATSSFNPKPSAAATPQAAGFPRATAAQSPLDVAVGKHLKGVLGKEPEFRRFQEARNRTLTVAEQVEQYRYLQGKLEELVGQDIPPEVDGAMGTITKEQVMRAFGLPAGKADECKEVLRLTDMYGPSGTVTKDPEAVKMFHEPPPISTNIQIGRYLDILRAVHSRWTAEHR